MNTATVGRVPAPVNGPVNGPVSGHVDRLETTRAYRSPQRERQAERTRRAVLRSARALFLRKGYADTTVAEVARRAKVSVDTLYTSVGRKPQLLLAVHDMELGGSDEPVPAEQRKYVAAVRAAKGARAKLATYAEALERAFPTTVPLAEALRVAAITDEDCRRVWESLNERRARNMLLLTRDLRDTGELRDDLSDEDVAHLIWTTNSPEFYLLVISGGRTAEQYATTVLDLWTRTLLA